MKIRIEKNQIDQMQCKNFILPCKWMNSTNNKTLNTPSTKSLLLLKISKKAIKLDSFLQYSVHIFLGHDGGSEKSIEWFCETLPWKTFK